MRTTPRSILFTIMMGGLVPALADESPDGGWQWGADGRGGYFASERDRRDGGSEDDHSGQLLLRLNTEYEPVVGWRFRARAAGTYSTDGNNIRLRLQPWRDSGTGVEPGYTTLDELFIERSWSGGHLRLGRLQTGFKLPVVPSKSLDRNDSSNVGIGWTDGLHWQQPLGENWRSHLIGQYYHSRGTGNTVRGPLDFSSSDSRVGLFGAVEASRNLGPIIQRMIAVTWMPDSLASEGIADPRRDDYLTATAKLAAGWTVNDQGMQLITAGEFGRAFNRPSRTALQLPGEGDAGGNAWQVAASLYDIRPGHHLGLVYGRAEGGWLISNDYRNNDELWEIRYQRRWHSALSMEIRYRWRQELEARTGSERRQRDQDVYARLTWRWGG